MNQRDVNEIAKQVGNAVGLNFEEEIPQIIRPTFNNLYSIIVDEIQTAFSKEALENELNCLEETFGKEDGEIKVRKYGENKIAPSIFESKEKAAEFFSNRKNIEKMAKKATLERLNDASQTGEYFQDINKLILFRDNAASETTVHELCHGIIAQNSESYKKTTQVLNIATQKFIELSKQIERISSKNPNEAVNILNVLPQLIQNSLRNANLTMITNEGLAEFLTLKTQEIRLKGNLLKATEVSQVMRHAKYLKETRSEFLDAAYATEHAIRLYALGLDLMKENLPNWDRLSRGEKIHALDLIFTSFPTPYELGELIEKPTAYGKRIGLFELQKQ